MNWKEKLLNEHKKYILSKDIFFDYIKEHDSFSSSVLKHTRSILIEYNTTFDFERKGNNREGVYTQKYIGEKIEDINLKIKIIKVRKDVPFLRQIHTYFHELAHLVNNHNEQYLNNDKLSTPQKEFVAETVSQALIYSFVGGRKIEDIPSNGKWDHELYLEKWISNAKFSESKVKEIWNQINFAYNKISKCIQSQIK